MKYIVEADEHVQMISLIAVREGTAIMITGSVEKFQTADKALDGAYQKGFEAGQHEATTLEYQQGLDDAWDCAKRIVLTKTDANCPYFTVAELEKIFGCSSSQSVFDTHSASEAIEKVKAYEGQQKPDKIVVGDEVKDRTDDFGVVTGIYGNDTYVLWQDGSTGDYAADELIKTGRHFNFLASLLEAMKEGAE